MKKCYLKTPEDVMALKYTDTKIYIEVHEGCYFKFIDGLLCWFDEGDERSWTLNTRITDSDKAYIIEEEPMQEATKDDIGTLCRFFSRDYKDAELGILKEVSYDDDEVRYLSKEDYWYYHCRRLSPSEVAEITGYKVEEAE